MAPLLATTDPGRDASRAHDDRALRGRHLVHPGAMEVVVAPLILILIILLVGGVGLLTFIVESFIAAGILGVIALALLIYLLLNR